MATAADLRTELVTAVDAIAGSHVTDDHRTDVALPTGSLDFQVRVWIERRDFDSSVAYERVRAEVTVASDVGRSASEAELAMLLAVQSQLLDPSFWRARAAVRGCELPEIVEMERTGNVVDFTVACIATLNA